jgi:hypothetical protein
MASNPPDSSSTTSVSSVQRFNLINDAYGPGTFAAWLLGAYSLFFQLNYTPKRPITHKDSQRYRNLDKDLAMVLTYPVAVAGHLL